MHRWRTTGLLVSFSLCAPALGGPAFITQHCRRVPLVLDETRLAVMSDDEWRAAPGTRGEAHALRGWTLVEREAGAPVDALQRAAGDETVDFTSPVFIDNLGGSMFITPVILVKFSGNLERAQTDALIAAADAGEITERDWAGMKGAMRITSRVRSGFDVLDAANRLAEMPGVEWAEPDMVFTGRGALVPNDPAYSQCWGIHNTGQLGGSADQDMDGQEAWDITTGSASIKILIIDTGVDQSHPDLNQVPGFDSTGENGGGGPVNQFDNHGTSVAGCCSAAINNALGGGGISPSCPAASARTFVTTNAQGNWSSSASMTVNSLAWGESIGVRVTNNSNYYGFTSSAIEQKYQDMRDAGVVHFGSAGNDGAASFISYPASLPTVNAVAALEPSGLRASFSNSGPEMFIGAPGVSVYSTDRQSTSGYSGGDYTFFAGTSAASPCAAGVAALVLSFNPLLSALDVENLLASTAVDRGAPGWDTSYGWGFINALAALQAAPPPEPPGGFSLIGPASGAVNVTRRPTLSWTDSTNATSFHVEVDDAPDFASPVRTADVLGVSYDWVGAPLNAATQYWWRVTAVNFLGSTPSMPASATFTTISVPPTAFSLTSPVAGAMNVSAAPLFTWEAAEFAESYTITIDDDANFSSPHTQTSVPGSMFQLITPLLGATTYHWRIAAINPLGQTLATPASSSFTTLVLPPASFALLSPDDGENVPTLTPTLQWQASTGATTYTLIVDDELGLGSPVLSLSGLTATSHAVPPGVLTNLTRYYWRVTGDNSAGSTVSSPGVSSFGVLVPACAGDSNSDGVVNFADISSTLTAWGTAGPFGDANHDNAVNFVDISTVLSNWQTMCE